MCLLVCSKESRSGSRANVSLNIDTMFRLHKCDQLLANHKRVASQLIRKYGKR